MATDDFLITGSGPNMTRPLALTRRLHIAALALILLSGASAPCCAGDIIAQIVERCPAQPRTFAQVTDFLHQTAETSSRVHLEVIGYSQQSRPLWLVTVTNPDRPPEEKMRLFIIARQHGNEPAGTTAALALIEHFAAAPSSLEQAVLNHLQIIAVPVANPDGAEADRRANGAGVDLNRDWVSATQPETQALLAAVEKYRPHTILDLHELPAYSKRAAYQENFLETVGASDALPSQLCAYTTAISRNISMWMSQYGYNLGVYYDYPGDSLRLCHRYLGLYQGFPTFLCEAKCGPGRPLAYRAGFHILACVVAANCLINGPVVPRRQYEQPAQVGQPPAEPAEAQLSSAAPAAPPPPTLTVATEPVTDTDGAELLRLSLHLSGGAGFAFCTIDVDETTKFLTNQRHFSCLLDVGDLRVGESLISARAYNASDQVLATKELTLTGLGVKERLGQ